MTPSPLTTNTMSLRAESSDAEGIAIQTRVYARHVHPIRKISGARLRHAFALQRFHHARGNRRDLVEPPEHESLQAQHDASHRLAAQQSHVEGKIHFEVLKMQPGARARQTRGQPAHRRAHERGGHRQDEIGPPEKLPHHERQRGDGEG
jgi:hypothetical protein